MGIYLDNSTATQTDPKVLDAMKEIYEKCDGVPRADIGHNLAMDAKEILDKSRKTIAESINAQFNEIIFTASKEESFNLIVRGLHSKNKEKNHLITTKIEDFSFLKMCKYLEKNKDFEVDYLDVDKEGKIDLNELKGKIKENTILVYVEHVNSEIGTIQDIEKIGEICKGKDVFFASDLTNSYMKLNTNVEKQNIDFAILNSAQIHGPKPICAVYKKKSIQITPLIFGSSGEFGLVPGMVNVPYIVGFAKAVELMKKQDNDKIRELRDYFKEELLGIKKTYINNPKNNIFNNLNVSFFGVEGEAMLLRMDSYGIFVKSGSSCFSEILESSHVLKAIEVPTELAQSSIIFTLSRFVNREDIKKTVEAVKEVLIDLRKISCMWDEKAE
ncbi:MAG: cysteine desulfurase [Candidatus Aenigmarchaeota archaeon]|nr:cysteine desulfurase [Candidatus Aenigmarchaeota archaeon]